MLLELWREMVCNMMSLMCHIVRATRILAVRRDVDDRHSSSSIHSSSTPLTDEGGRGPSPNPPPPPSPHLDEQETLIPPPRDLPLPPDNPSSSTTDQASTTIVDMIITLF
jgi:hypothetical protein